MDTGISAFILKTLKLLWEVIKGLITFWKFLSENKYLVELQEGWILWDFFGPIRTLRFIVARLSISNNTRSEVSIVDVVMKFPRFWPLWTNLRGIKVVLFNVEDDFNVSPAGAAYVPIKERFNPILIKPGNTINCLLGLHVSRWRDSFTRQIAGLNEPEWYARSGPRLARKLSGRRRWRILVRFNDGTKLNPSLRRLRVIEEPALYVNMRCRRCKTVLYWGILKRTLFADEEYMGEKIPDSGFKVKCSRCGTMRKFRPYSENSKMISNIIWEERKRGKL